VSWHVGDGAWTDFFESRGSQRPPTSSSTRPDKRVRSSCGKGIEANDRRRWNSVVSTRKAVPASVAHGHRENVLRQLRLLNACFHRGHLREWLRERGLEDVGKPGMARKVCDGSSPNSALYRSVKWLRWMNPWSAAALRDAQLSRSRRHQARLRTSFSLRLRR